MITHLSIPAGPSSCAEATTTKEAAYRLDYTLAAARNTRVIAFDAEAEAVVRETSRLVWNAARFYVATGQGGLLKLGDSDEVELADIIADSNTVVMVSTTGENAAAMAIVGEACYSRGIMTAGLAMVPDSIDSDALHHLRPHARILLVPAEHEDLVELLQAIRA